MTRLIAMAREEEKQNNWQCKLMHDNIRQNQLCIPTTNKAIPKPHERDAGMALLNAMLSASAETAHYLYEPLPVEKFK